MGHTCNTHGKDEECIDKFWSENLNGRYRYVDLSVGGRENVTLKRILKKQCARTWNRFVWLRTGTSGRLL